MKKLIVAIIVGLLIIAGVVAYALSLPNKPQPEPTPTPPPVTISKVDQAFIEKYIIKPESVLEENFIVTETKKMDSDDLYDFFLAMSEDDLGQYQNDGMYHFPVAQINEVLSQYFLTYSFEPTHIDDYNMAEDSVDTTRIDLEKDPIYYNVNYSQEEGELIQMQVTFFEDAALTIQKYIKDYTIITQNDQIKYQTITIK